jgi:hypothetical protein
MVFAIGPDTAEFPEVGLDETPIDPIWHIVIKWLTELKA